MKEIGRKPYLSKSYRKMMKKTSNVAMWNQIKSKHSEYEKPYMHKAGEYGEMQHYYPNLSGFTPGDDLKFDHPWMNEQVSDAKKIGRVFHLFPGCGFVFPGLFSTIARCETKCEVLDDWYKWADGSPQDPIVSWKAINGVITESDIFHACVKADEEAPYGQFVELIATTKSGDTCRGFAWVKGNECCCANVSISYTTQQMAVDEVQTLTVTNERAGCTYNWAIDSGGGSLSAATGLSVDYTAPSFNANCENNPVISLSAKGNVCDILAIAVSEEPSGNAYHKVDYCEISCTGSDRDTVYCRGYHYDCVDVRGDSFTTACYLGDRGSNLPHEDCATKCGECKVPGDTIGCVSGRVSDVRTETQIANGCCPAGLL